MRKVEAVLESTHSPYLPPFQTLKQSIDQGIALAAENVKYLTILEAPCTALSKAAPKVSMAEHTQTCWPFSWHLWQVGDV